MPPSPREPATLCHPRLSPHAPGCFWTAFTHAVAVGVRVQAACHGRAESYEIYHHHYEAFVQVVVVVVVVVATAAAAAAVIVVVVVVVLVVVVVVVVVACDACIA